MATAANEDAIIKEPIDMLRLSLDDRVYVKCRCVQHCLFNFARDSHIHIFREQVFIYSVREIKCTACRELD